MLKITKMDFELGKNTEKVPNGLWFYVADYVKRGEDSYDRAKRRFAVTTIVSELNEIRARENTDESDFRLILMAEINQVYLISLNHKVIMLKINYVITVKSLEHCSNI